LSSAEQKKIVELLEKVHTAVLQKQQDLEHLSTANKLFEQNQLTKAKILLEGIKDSQFLTKQDRQLITEQLKKIDNQLNEQKRQISELYNHSVELYNTGRLEKAREGFLQVAKSNLSVGSPGKTAEDYLTKIDNTLLNKLKSSQLIESKYEAADKNSSAELIQQAEPQIFKEQGGTSKANAAKPTTDKDEQLETINRKASILRSYNSAVISDLISKAQIYLDHSEFENAEKTVTRAEQTAKRNQLALGEKLFNQYSLQLKKLAEEVAQRQDETTQQLEQQNRLEQTAIETQRQYREQIEADGKKIAELMDETKAELERQHYEKAVEKLRELLALVEKVAQNEDNK
jgi:urease gamma subunit